MKFRQGGHVISTASIASLALAMLVLAASPGPGVFTTVARTLASGFRSALLVIAGIVLGDIIFLLFAMFGLSVIARILGEFFIIVKVLGGTYLIWVGCKLWFKNPSTETLPNGPPRSIQLGNFFSGFLVTLSNPKVILFYCGFLPTFMNLSTLSFVDGAIVVFVVTGVLSSVLLAYAFLASHARHLFTERRAVRKLNRAAGGVMIATGVVIATRQ